MNIRRALNRAGSTGQDKDPRVTRGELASILDRPNVGPIALRNQIRQGETAISRDATKFLNERLKAMGARPIETRTTSATAPNVQNTNQNRIQPFNSGSNPINPQQTMLASARTGQPASARTGQPARASAPQPARASAPQPARASAPQPARASAPKASAPKASAPKASAPKARVVQKARAVTNNAKKKK